MDDLIPCTAKEFDRATLYYASQGGWSMRSRHGEWSKGYVNGRLVLLLRRRGKTPYADHFMAPRPEAPVRVLPEGFRYR